MTISVTSAVSVRRVLVTVASSPAVTDALKVWRVHPDGSRHRVLTVGQAVLIGGWVGYDYHAPFNQPVTYVAEAAGQTSVASNTIRLISKRSWIIHPSDPDLSLAVQLVGPPADTSADVAVQRFDVLNRKLPVFRKSRPRGGESSSLSVLAQTSKEIAQLKALFADGGPVLLNTVWKNDMGWMWVQPGSLGRKVLGRADQDVRQFTFGYDECGEPDVDLVPQWTFDKMAARYSNFAEATADYGDFTKMKLDVRGS